MSKKDFNAVFDRVSGTEEPAEPITAAEKEEKEEKQAVFSFRINPETADIIKDYAYTKRISIKKAVETIVDTFMEQYESDPNNEKLLKHK